MRSIAAAIMMFTTLVLVLPTAAAQDSTPTWPGYDSLHAPTDAPQPTRRSWLDQVGKDNRQLDVPTCLPATTVMTSFASEA